MSMSSSDYFNWAKIIIRGSRLFPINWACKQHSSDLFCLVCKYYLMGNSWQKLIVSSLFSTATRTVIPVLTSIGSQKEKKIWSVYRLLSLVFIVVYVVCHLVLMYVCSLLRTRVKFFIFYVPTYSAHIAACDPEPFVKITHYYNHKTTFYFHLAMQKLCISSPEPCPIGWGAAGPTL